MKIPNEYEVHGNITYIIIKRVNGKVFKAIIDTKNLDLVKNTEGNWRINHKRNNAPYVEAKKMKKGKVTITHLHRLIMNAPPGMLVDHINRNPLDNREENLRIVTNAENCQNHPEFKSNTKSGIRGVFELGENRWIAYARVKGVLKHVGVFESKEGARVAVKEFRRKHMPFSNEDVI